MRVRWICAVALLFVSPCAADQKCMPCHPKQTVKFDRAAMTRALLPPTTDAGLLGENMSFRDGKWTYRIARENGAAMYSVSDGQSTFAVPILWSFGSGKAGQTYVLKHEMGLYESRVSYYTSIKGLDLTLGAIRSKPDSLSTAAGRRLTAHEVSECFGCHSTGSSPTTPFAMDTMHPGVQCGACHDSVDKHATAFASKSAAPVLPRTLTKLTTEETSELCGRCHRTWEQITINGPRGVANVRFQPYRLTNSKCYDSQDRRIACVACHDPHSPLEIRTETYDVRCKSCHRPGSTSPGASRICKVETRRCAECHMPKYAIPGSHIVFNDHQIRIVRGREQYPN